MRRHDGRLHVAGRAVDVAIDPEGQLNIGGSDAARRGHVVDIGDGAEVPLQGRRHRACHDLRAGSRQLGRDEDCRDIDARQGRDRQQHERRGAARATPAVRRVVATGRWMKGAEMFTRVPRPPVRFPRPPEVCACGGDPVERQIDDRRGEQGQHLAHQQSPDDADAEGCRSSEPVPVPNMSGRAPNHGGDGGHENGAKAQQAGLVDRIARRQFLSRCATTAKSIIRMAFSSRCR